MGTKWRSRKGRNGNMRGQNGATNWQRGEYFTLSLHMACQRWLMVAVNVEIFCLLTLLVSTEGGEIPWRIWTFQERSISPVFTHWEASGCMDLGWLKSARLENSNYRRLACTVWLVDHRLHYSPPRINEPAQSGSEGGEDCKGEEDRKGRRGDKNTETQSELYSKQD